MVDGPGLPRADDRPLLQPENLRFFRAESTYSASEVQACRRNSRHAARMEDLVNRSQLLNKFAEDNEHHPQGSRRVLDVARRHHHRGTVASGEDVAISGFAKFRRIDRPARLARNPATGETVKVKAKRVRGSRRSRTSRTRCSRARRPKKAPAKAVAKKAPAKKAPAKKAPAKKKAVAKKAPAKKAPARKARQASLSSLRRDSRKRSWARAECPGPLAFTLPRRATPCPRSSSSASGCR